MKQFLNKKSRQIKRDKFQGIKPKCPTQKAKEQTQDATGMLSNIQDKNSTFAYQNNICTVEMSGLGVTEEPYLNS